MTHCRILRLRPLLYAAGLAFGMAAPALLADRAAAVCVGDCNGDSRVSIAEAQACVNRGADLLAPPCAAADQNGDGDVSPNEVDACIQSFLDPATCPMVFTPAATATQPAATNTPVKTNTSAATSTSTTVPTITRTPTPLPPTPTATKAPTCPIAAGVYTITNAAGGTLQVGGIGAPNGFPFPTGGTVVQDVHAASPPACVHDTVVPATGGFTAPPFCIAGLNFTVQVKQDGCGIGQIDSNGGSDFTILEQGDTSDNSSACNLPNPGCPPGPPSATMRDSSLRVDIKVGDGVPDTCTSGTGNAVVAIPVKTTTWTPPDFSCPDTDGRYDPPGDTLVLLISQILDFTTDTNLAKWTDLDGDGCSVSGSGPANGLSRTGTCVDFTAKTVTTAAAGTIGSNGAPLFDLTFATRLPNTLSGPTAPSGATCSNPPAINFAGTATRCIP